MTITLPPYTGDTDLDYFNAEVARQINSGDLGAGGTSDIETGTDDEAYPTVGGLRVQYQERYLHTRYGTSSSGANFTDDYTTISGLTVFQGLRNSASETESTNPADYTWRQINVIAGWIPSYRIVGGRLVDWDFSTVTPDGFTVDEGDDFDLDTFATEGMDGEDGNSSRLDIAYATVLDQPVREAQNVAVNTAAKLWTGGTYSVNEQQALGYDNTQGSNLLTGGENEFITIGFDPTFDSGFSRERSTLSSTENLGSVTFADNVNTAWWPGTAITPTTSDNWNTDLIYVPGTGETFNSTQLTLNEEKPGMLYNDGSSTFSLQDFTIEVDIDITASTNTSQDIEFAISLLKSGAHNPVTLGSDNFNDSNLGPSTRSVTYTSTSQVFEPGDTILFYVWYRGTNDVTDFPVTFEVTGFEIRFEQLQTTHYDFDIDTSGVHFPGTGGTIDIDCTNVSLSVVSANLRYWGTWVDTTGSVNNRRIDLAASATPADIATSFFTVADREKLTGYLIQRGTGVGDSFVADPSGLVVRIESPVGASDGFTFWTDTDPVPDTNAFNWGTFWQTTPLIYANGLEYVVVGVDTPRAIGGSIHSVTDNFPENINSGQLAAQHLHDEIESTYAGVTVAGPTEIAGVGGTIDIDCTNASGSGTIFGYLFGDWRTDGNEVFFLSGTYTLEDIVSEIFSEANTSLRSDITVSRGSGIGDDFVEDSAGLVIRIASLTNGFRFWMHRTSSAASLDVFTWDSDWDVIPTIYANGIEYPTSDTVFDSEGTPLITIGLRSQIQIVVDTGIADDVSDASLAISENTGSNTEPLTFLVRDGLDPVIGDHTTYIVRSTNGSEITMFTSSTTNPGISDMPFVRSSIVEAVNSFTESPTNFNAIDDTTNNQLVFTADTPEPVEGNITVEVQNGAGTGNVVFTPSTIAEGVSPIEVTGPTLSLTAPGSNIGVEYVPFSGDSISTEKNFEEIAIDIRTNFDPADWSLGGIERNILFVKDVGGIVTGEWDIVVSGYGTSVTDPSIFNDNSFVTSIITPGEALVGNVIYSSGRLATGDYAQAVAGPTSNYRAERVVNWMPPTPEPEVSTEVGDYSFNRWVTEGDTVDLRIDLSNGNTFRNNQGSTELKTTILINGIEATENDHSLYDYKWTYQGNTICVDNNRNVLDDNGLPLTATFDDDNNLVCSLGSPADSTISPALGATLRRINAGAEEVTNATQFVCDVSNI